MCDSKTYRVGPVGYAVLDDASLLAWKRALFNGFVYLPERGMSLEQCFRYFLHSTVTTASAGACESRFRPYTLPLCCLDLSSFGWSLGHSALVETNLY